MSTRERKPHPPRWLDKLVERFCAPHLLEQVMGDLHERYYRRVERQGEAKARRMYWREVLAYMRPSVFKRKTFIVLNLSQLICLQTISTSPSGIFSERKIYSGINILGLSIGLACSFFILLWVIDETSYDRFHTNGHQIHQAWRHFTTGGQTYTMTSLPRGIADEMSAEFPEVEETVITFMDQELVVTSGDNNYRETGGYVGATFFRIFSFPFIHGNPETALQGMTSAVITERTARKIFGDDWENALGRSITVDHRKEFTITGVVRDVPENSSLQFDILLPVEEYFARDKRLGALVLHGLRYLREVAGRHLAGRIQPKSW